MKNLFLFLLAGVVLFSCRKELNSDQAQTFHPRSYSGIEPYTDSYDEAALNLDDSEDERINKAIIIAALALEDYICDETFQDALLNYLSSNNQEFMWLSDLMDILSESQAYDQRIQQTNPFTNFSGFSDLADMEDNLEHTSIDYAIAIGVLLGQTTNENPLFVTAVELDDIDSTYEDNVLGWLPGEAGNLNSPIYVSEEIAFSDGEGLVISLVVYPKDSVFQMRSYPYGLPSEDAEEFVLLEEGLWEAPKMVIKYRFERAGKSEVCFVGQATDAYSDDAWDLFFNYGTSIQGTNTQYWPRYKQALDVPKNKINTYSHIGTHVFSSNGHQDRPKDLTLRRVHPSYFATTKYYYIVHEYDWSNPFHLVLKEYDSNIGDFIELKGQMKYPGDWYLLGLVPLSQVSNSSNYPWVDSYSRIDIVWDHWIQGL